MTNLSDVDPLLTTGDLVTKGSYCIIQTFPACHFFFSILLLVDPDKTEFQTFWTCLFFLLFLSQVGAGTMVWSDAGGGDRKLKRILIAMLPEHKHNAKCFMIHAKQ